MWCADASRCSALAVILITAAGLRPLAQAPSGTFPKTIRPPVPLGEFCDPSSPESTPVAITGRRLQWARPLPMGRTASEIVERARAEDRLLVAVTRRWLVIHDPSLGRTSRADCETGNVDHIPQRRRIAALSVSEFGDIAARTEAGPTLLFVRHVGNTAREETGVELDSGSVAPSALAWSARRLLIAQQKELRVVDIPSNAWLGYSRQAQVDTKPVPPIALALEAPPSALFTFNGLTYLASGSCVDILVGRELAPTIRQAACFARAAPEDSLLVASPDSLAVVSGEGAPRETVPRPSVVHATVAGTGWDITAALLRLMQHTDIPRIPLRNTDAPRAGAGATAGWADLFPPEYWKEKGAYDEMLRAARAKGWVDLQPAKGGTEWSGNGVAVGWRQGESLVAPAGRSLVSLDLLGAGLLTDRNVRQIITGNSVLADTLEGTFIEKGWLPIGALFGSDTQMPVSFTFGALGEFHGLAKLEAGPTLLPTGRCRKPQETTDDRPLTALLSRGFTVAGAIQDRADERRRFRAESVRIEACAGGPQAVETALLSGVQLPETAAQKPAATSPVVVAVRGLPSPLTARLLRSWLDRVLRTRTNLQPLLVPTTTLEMDFVVDARIARAGLRVTGVKLTSEEAGPAAARAAQDDQCKVVEAALKARLRDEQAMHFRSVDFASRTLAPPLKIAVAENAVPLLGALFVRDGESVWVEPKDNGGFGPIQPPLAVDPTTRALNFRRHGAQVAGILFTGTHAPVRGVLSDAPLVWIDTMDSPQSSTHTLDKLAARKAIVNVSDRLDPAWASLSENNKSWMAGLLFVGAAKNPENDTDGPPLTWETRGNVIGVGIVDGNGDIPDNSKYERSVVDLLAPGAGVPTVDDESNLGCAEGTSFATAYVSAVAALVADRAPRGWTVGQLKARLLATAEWKPTYAGKVRAGRINADRALEHLDKNILSIARGSSAPLQLSVTWKDASAFDVTGEEVPNTPRTQHRIQWSDILRWQLVESPNQGAWTRLTFIAPTGQFVVLDKVALPVNLRLPINTCRIPGAPDAATCDGMRPDQIREYTAALPQALMITFK